MLPSVVGRRSPTIAGNKDLADGRSGLTLLFHYRMAAVQSHKATPGPSTQQKNPQKRTGLCLQRMHTQRRRMCTVVCGERLWPTALCVITSPCFVRSAENRGGERIALLRLGRNHGGRSRNLPHNKDSLFQRRRGSEGPQRPTHEPLNWIMGNVPH